VVATDVGGTREVVGAELADCLVAPGSPIELRKRIRRVVTLPEESRAKAVRGRCRVIERFDHDKRVAMLRALYLDVAGLTDG